MLTPAQREHAVTEAAQAVRDKELLQRLDKIIELLTEIRDGTTPQAPPQAAQEPRPGAD